MGLQRRRIFGLALAVLFWFLSTLAKSGPSSSNAINVGHHRFSSGTRVVGLIKVHEVQVDDSTHILQYHKHQNQWLPKVELQGWRRKLQTTRRPIGPGSSPPTCRNRCGRCSPCRAVHVPIQPGVSQPLDYYPEAWRCSCGNKYFMP